MSKYDDLQDEANSATTLKAIIGLMEVIKTQNQALKEMNESQKLVLEGMAILIAALPQAKGVNFKPPVPAFDMDKIMKAWGE